MPQSYFLSTGKISCSCTKNGRPEGAASNKLKLQPYSGYAFSQNQPDWFGMTREVLKFPGNCGFVQPLSMAKGRRKPPCPRAKRDVTTAARL
ncbi:hypothetical protein [Leisingera daeponensis]|uniref:hypothetical protein n=1 Tax=Leisingera daeponensis TaxID=405746 RepID=UPI001C95F301|nr:hypothetical protein [Leisingera daeponensis]MBY6055745.1 hypothetical protein [Leisingera daeponensis]